MSSNQRSLTEDEVYLRVAAPGFFEELVSAHTASLIESGNPEAFTAWKEVRLRNDREFATLADEERRQVNELRQSQSFERQSVDFAAAVTRFAAEAEIPLAQYNLSPQEAVDLHRRIIHEEWEQDLGDIAPQEDMRFVASREIEQSRNRHLEETAPERNEFGKMSQTAREEFLNEQREVGKAALLAQQQSPHQTQDRDIDPPEHGD